MNKNIVKWVLFTIIGALLGFGYYYFIGCNTGNCPITSNWHISTLYGAAIGFIAGLPTKKKRNNES